MNYNAKLGIKQNVSIKLISENELEITIPKFKIIGVDLDKDEPYCLYDTHSGLLSAPTPNIDTGELVALGLSSDSQLIYLYKYIIWHHLNCSS